MANKPINKGGRPKGSRDVAGKVRWGLLKAVDNIKHKTGMDMAALIEKEIEEHGFVHVAKALSSFVPKEMDIRTTEMAPEEWLEMMNDRQPESTGSEEEVPGQLH